MASQTGFNPAAWSIQGNSYNFLSTYDIIKREVDPTIVKRYGNQRLTDIITQLGNAVETGNILYEHYEEDRIMPKIKATTAGAAAGVVATFTLSATTPAQIFALAQYSPYLTTTTPTYNAGVPVRPGDTIMIPAQSGANTAATLTEYQVLTVNTTAGTFTAQPTDPAIVTPAIGTAIEMIIVGSAFGEGSDKAISLTEGFLHYQNNTQIFKDSFKVTGTVNAMADNYGGVDYTVHGEASAYTRFANKNELALLVGDAITNATLADVYQTTPIKKTKGLIPEILDNGYIQGYSLLTGFGVTEFENLTTNLDLLKGATENYIFDGLALSMNIDRQCRDLFKNGAISYGAINGDQNKALAVEFNSLSVGNYTYHKRTVPVFTDLQTLGAVGFNFPNEGMVVPADAMKDPKSGSKISSLRRRYLKGREMEVIPVDNKRVGDGTDTYQVDYYSEQGLEVMGAGRFAYIVTQ